MKHKQKNNIHAIFVSWIKKYLIYQTPLVLLFAVLFVFPSKCKADELPMISAVQIKGVSANDDFIEIYNPGCSDKDISDWKLRKRTSSGSESSIKVLDDKTMISAKGYFLWSNSGLAASVNADQSTGATLSENYSIALVDGEKIIDSITWGNNSHQFLGSHWYADNFVASQVLKKDINNDFKIEEGYFPKNSTFTNKGELESCPKKEPEPEPIPVPEPEKKEYPKSISIMELFPNPFKSEYEEYIELYNGSGEDVDLIGWTLRDASKSGKYTFAESMILKAKKYLAVFKKDFKFALNNSGKESVTLFDPNGEKISEVSYDGSKKNISYNFNGATWHWSKFLTPGAENILNNEPYGTLKIDKDIFEKAYANFSISAGDNDGDKVKITWYFGDGHKSYLAKTRHKYAKTGKYEASVKLSDGSEDLVKKFMVEVKKFPHPEVRIVSFKANPTGSDTLGENLVIQNKSKKKIDLMGWSIATGAKTLVNHPIIEKFVIKKKESREITREISKFTLNNKKGKIELRYPDGEVADKIKYDHGKISIADDEVYRKVKGGWEWQKNLQPIADNKQQDANKIFAAGLSSGQNAEIKEVEENKIEEIAVPIEIFENKFILLSNESVKIELLKSTLRKTDTEAVREIDGIYFFTPQTIEQEHYLIIFLKNISSDLNLKLNMLLNSLELPGLEW